jgi:hypothetical protein
VLSLNGRKSAETDCVDTATRRYRTVVNPALKAGDVGRSWTLRGLLDVELDVLTLFEVRAANVFHVEEDVVVSIVSVDKSVAACVVEEINGSLRHCI